MKSIIGRYSNAVAVASLLLGCSTLDSVLASVVILKPGESIQLRGGEESEVQCGYMDLKKISTACSIVWRTKEGAWYVTIGKLSAQSYRNFDEALAAWKNLVESGICRPDIDGNSANSWSGGWTSP